MNPDFHYYATYCAAVLAGYSHEQGLTIAYCDQLVDLCSKTFLSGIRGPLSAATTQLQLELMDTKTDVLGLQDITRIWASFHFLPKDLLADPGFRCFKKYRNKFRLICGPNGELLKKTVELAKNKSLQAVGLSMHILADTWAHQHFAGTPSMVINNTNYYFFELFPEGDGYREKRLTFRHSATTPDDLENGIYTNSLDTNNENSIMNLGHGRAGHLPDYSFIRYKYLPAWGQYEVIIKDNPSDYWNAFCQMIYAMKYLRGETDLFECGQYDRDTVAPYEETIRNILQKRQPDASEDWKAFGESLSGQTIPPFDLSLHQEEYRSAQQDAKTETFLGKFILAALAQKSMITREIYQTGSKLAGYSVDYNRKGFIGNKDYRQLVTYQEEGRKK